MTQAMSWDQLYAFEDSIEAAAKSILSTASVIASTSIFTQQSDSDLVTPRISLQFVVSGALGQYMIRASDSQPFNAAWSGTLGVSIITDRAQNQSEHSGLRTAVRRVLSQVNLWDNSTLLPYFFPFEVIEGASSPTIQTDMDLDITLISFEMKVGFRTDALPSTGP